MGAWGAGLFANDTSCDVRDDYVRHLTHGLSAEEACQKILARYGDLLANTGIACLVYFALADTAWRYGRLDQALKDKALSLLQSGGDIDVWERDAPDDVASRRKTPQALEARLHTPQPPEKPIQVSPPEPKKIRTTAPVGTVFSLGLPLGGSALLVLVGFAELENSVDPVFSVLCQRFASSSEMPAQITVSDATLVLSKTSYQPYQHVAILPKDERKNILAGLGQTSIPVAGAMPYQRERTVWLALGRIAKEIDAHLATEPAHA